MLALGLGAEGFSTGNAAAARTGCGPQAGCHGVPGTPTPFVFAILDGVPETYTPGEAYELTAHADGGPPVLPAAQNQGGFALEVTAGTLAVVDENAQAGGGLATHTEVGNDQRSWDLLWTAPPPGAGEVLLYLSVNAVNGNGLQDPGDLWASSSFASAEGEAAAGTAAPAGNDTVPPGPTPQRTPGPEPALVVAGLGAWALATRRQR